MIGVRASAMAGGLHSLRAARKLGADLAIKHTGLRRSKRLKEALSIGDNDSATAHPVIMRHDLCYRTQ